MRRATARCGSIGKLQANTRGIRPAKAGREALRSPADTKSSFFLGPDGTFGDGSGKGRPVRTEKPRSEERGVVTKPCSRIQKDGL
ncbi:MAG: hypothetical protein KatS3mg072_2500 [Meiothermus sp.]|nr:MAG: hypothetical protein KatS3mg072_2500 [Meiothermus sp.]